VLVSFRIRRVWYNKQVDRHYALRTAFTIHDQKRKSVACIQVLIAADKAT